MDSIEFQAEDEVVQTINKRRLTEMGERPFNSRSRNDHRSHVALETQL